MKMTEAHYSALKEKIELVIPYLGEIYARASSDKRVQSLPKRLLWDTFHASKIRNDYSYQEFDYMDAHIETAMRAAFKELNIDPNTLEHSPANLICQP